MTNCLHNSFSLPQPNTNTNQKKKKHPALGDPLIKGLTEVANSRPSNPVKFLADYLHSIADNKRIVIFLFSVCFDCTDIFDR